eukprot:gene6390-8803_t
MATIMISINVKTMGETGELLKSFFERNNITCWICTSMNGGVEFREEIVEAVKKCKIFLPLINDEWARSGECKDEYNLAKRLNLTSHESGRTVEGEKRLPVILPIAFPNLIWNKYSHVELLAASTNFIVHKESAMLEGNEAYIETINSLIRSIKDLGLSDLEIFGELDEKPSQTTVVKGDSSDSSQTQLELKGQLRNVTLQLNDVIQQMMNLQSVISRPVVSATKIISQSSVQSTPLFPINGWLNEHVKGRYLGILYEFCADCRVTWSLELVLELVGDENAIPLQVSGYIRWRMMNAVATVDNDRSRWYLKSRYERITDGWEQDELFNGEFDRNTGNLKLKTYSLRHVEGKKPYPPKDMLCECVYQFTLIHDGTELVGRYMPISQLSMDKEEFLSANIIRCIAF